jgi:hypothetical protein
MWATYIDDFVGVANRHFIGVDNLLWSSGYPHQASTWPHSQEIVARDFKDASAEDEFNITRGTGVAVARSPVRIQYPTPDGFIGDVEPPFGQQLLDVAIAQREA